MSINSTTQQLQNVFTFPFKDPDWFKKLTIGSLLILSGFIIPIVPILFVYGYCMRIMERIIVQGGELFLPEWDDWGKYFTDGARLFGAGMIYALPVIFLIFLGYLVAFLPSFLIPLTESMADTTTSAFAFFPLLLMLFGVGLISIGMLIGILLGLVVPAGLGHLVAKDRFSAAFQVNEWWPIFRANFAGFLVAFVILMGISMIFGFIFQIMYITIILCCLLPLVVSVFSMYVSLISMTLFAQAYSDGVHKLGG
jgi:hypothetical protein